MYLLGTDEAGYGPNLGPLVVSATLWRVPAATGEDLYAALAPAICRDPVGADDHRAPIADSKRLYAAGDSWEQLELGLLSALALCGRSCDTWRNVWQALAPRSVEDLVAECWCEAFDMPTPHAACAQRLARVAAAWQAAAAASGVELRTIHARPVFPAEFNRLIDEFDNKAAALSHVTLTLVRELYDAAELDEPLVVHCDKHGGRDRYYALLQHFFPDELIEIRCEGRAKSVYRFGPPERRVEVRFVAKGDNFPPAALASMACKYLRELAMHAFNQFWQRHVPDLKPTAGYPDDAKRFWRDIAKARKKLKLADEVLWRKR